MMEGPPSHRGRRKALTTFVVSAALLSLVLHASADLHGRADHAVLHRTAFYIPNDPIAEAYAKGLETGDTALPFDPRDHIGAREAPQERHLGAAPAASGVAPGSADGEAYEAPVSQYPEVVQLRQLAQSGQSDIWTLIRLLVDDFCAKMTGPNSPGCEVDMEGTTDWYKRYFSKQPPLAATTGVTDMVITRSARTPPSRTSTRAMYCAPTAATDQQDCSLSGRLESSGSVQTTRTNAFSFQGKVGAVYKWKSAVHELTVESTVDFGYSFSNAEATANVQGDATVAQVTVPMPPNENVCVYIEMYMERSTVQGNIDVYVEMDGWVGTRQDKRRRWAAYDGPDEESQHRAIRFSEVVRRSKSLGIFRARDWSIGANGLARLKTTVQMDMNLAVRTYTNPQKWPATDSRCIEAQRNFSYFNQFTPGTTPAPTPTPAPAPRGRMLLQNRPPTTPGQNLQENMRNLVQAFCRYQSDNECDIDWDCTTEWCRTDFSSRQPATVRTGLDDPVMPESGRVIENKTTAVMLCPSRPYRYSCRLEKQAIQASVTTNTRTEGWNVGTTTKVTALYGFNFLNTGALGGTSVQFSFSYNFQTATATAETQTSSTTDAISVQMAPNTQQCAYITNNMQVLNAQGSQFAYITVDGYVATQQRQRRHWKLDSPGEDHYYRNLCLEYNLTEARDWTYDSRNGARISVPIELEVELGTRGYAETRTFPEGSPECSQNTIGQPTVVRRSCVRRADYNGLWCSAPGTQYQSLDCDGDGKIDHVCSDRPGGQGRRWAMLSSQGCEDTGPNATRAMCPRATIFNNACTRPTGWCGATGSRYSSLDCDGDGKLDLACISPTGRRTVMLSSRQCASAAEGSAVISDCPAYFSSPSPRSG